MVSFNSIYNKSKFDVSLEKVYKMVEHDMDNKKDFEENIKFIS